VKRILASLLLASVAVPVLAQGNSKDKPTLSEAFKNARYVYVEALNGDSMNPDVTPGDREAIYNVRQQLRDWGRYSTTTDRDHADLIVVVHKAHSNNSSLPADVGVGTPQRPSPRGTIPNNPPAGGRDVATDAEIGPPDDQLSVYLLSPSGSRTGPIWQQTQRSGLDAPKIQLFKRLKHDVDTAYPQ
jgi:hypothetical protein